MRHLSEQQALSALGRGVSIEQMLTASPSERTIRWFGALPTGASFALRLHHVRDDGSDDFLDIYEFRAVEEEEELGEGRLVGEYPDASSVLEGAVVLAGRTDRWVDAGVIQDEYARLQGAMR